MKFSSSKHGYIFLVTVLLGGTIAMATTISLLLLGLAAERTASSFEDSTEALEQARTCAERAILSLRTDPTYGGQETIVAGENDSCIIHPIGGSGNMNRTLCTEGKDGEDVRRMEIQISQLFPWVSISSWREVDVITLCP
jgi:hypothetical protein